MDEEKLKTLHSNLVKDGYDLPDYEVFKNDMADESKLQKFHGNLVNDGYELPEYNTFKTDMFGGAEKKSPNQTEPANTGSSESGLSSPEQNTQVPFKEAGNSNDGVGTFQDVAKKISPQQATDFLKQASGILKTQQEEMDKTKGQINSAPNPETAALLADTYKKQEADYNTTQKSISDLSLKKRDIAQVPQLEQSFGSELYESFKRGSESLGSMIAKTPAFVNDVAASAVNKVAEYAELPPQLATSEQIAHQLNLPENEVANWYDAKVKESQEKIAEKYDKGVTEYLSNGEYKKGFKLLANQVVESAPISMSLAMGNAAGLTAAQSILGGGAVFGAGNKAESDEQNPDMPENDKIANSVSKGLFEGMFEQFGITKLGSIAKDVFLKGGEKAAADIAKEGFIQTYKPIAKKYLGNQAEEAVSEGATQFAQNAVDKYSGAKPDINLMDGVADAALVGLGSGVAASAPVGTADIIKKYKSKNFAAKEAVKPTDADLKTELDAHVKAGVMSEQDAQEVVQNVENAKVVNEGIPIKKNDTESSRIKKVRLALRRTELEEELKKAQFQSDKDAIKAKIEQIEEDYKTLNNAKPDAQKEGDTTNTTTYEKAKGNQEAEVLTENKGEQVSPTSEINNEIITNDNKTETETGVQHPESEAKPNDASVGANEQKTVDAKRPTGVKQATRDLVRKFVSTDKSLHDINNEFRNEHPDLDITNEELNDAIKKELVQVRFNTKIKELKEQFKLKAIYQKAVTDYELADAKAKADKKIGKIKSDTQNKLSELKDKLNSSKAKISALRDLGESIKDFINDANIKGNLSASQTKSLIKRAATVKTDNQLDKFVEYANRVIEDVNYANELDNVSLLQSKAKKIKHSAFDKIVKEFASVNPQDIPPDKIAEYKKALDELTSKVPDYTTTERIFHDIVSNTPIKNFDAVDTFEKAQEKYSNIFKNKIESVEDYRKLFSDINGLKRRLGELVDVGHITNEQFDDIMDEVGKTTKEVNEKFHEEIRILKQDLISEIRTKGLDIPYSTPEEKNIRDVFKEQNNADLQRLDPETLWELNELIDRATNGHFDYYRLNSIANDVVAKRNGEAVGKQLEGAKLSPPQDIKNRLAKEEAPFIESVLGLGSHKVGALSRFVTSLMEKAAGNYTKSIKDGMHEFLTLKKGIDREQMNKIGVVTTYLQEYMAQFNPDFKNVKNIGKRDWFGDIMKKGEYRRIYEGEKIGRKNKAEIIDDVLKNLPKNKDGSVDVEAVYNSVISKDGKVLNPKEQAFFDGIMSYMDKNIMPKQQSANYARGKGFDALAFYAPRIDLQSPKEIETKVERSGTNVRIKSGFGESRTSQSIRPIETDFEKLFPKALEAANRDYYFGNTLDVVNRTLGEASKVSEKSKEVSNIVAENVSDMINFEFALHQADVGDKVLSTLLKARAAKTLFNPIRALLVELPSTYLQVPLRAGNLRGYSDVLSSGVNKTVNNLLDFTESPLRLRENISKQIDVEQGEIKPQNKFDKATLFLAGMPERLTFKGAWYPTFINEFEQLTGEKFNPEKFNSDKSYKEQFSRELKEAGSVADITTQKIIGGTTKLSQSREISLPFMEDKKGISKDKSAGKVIGFFGNYPRREFIEFVNGFKEVAERYKNGEGIESTTSLSKPLAVSMGALSYAFMGSLVYLIRSKMFGSDDEKKKAEEELNTLLSIEGIADEAVGQMLSLAGSKYYAIGRGAVQSALTIAYAAAKDEKTKAKLSKLYKANYFKEPLTPSLKETAGKSNKQKFEDAFVAYLPAFSIVVDQYQSIFGDAARDVKKLYEQYEKSGFEGMTDEQKDKIMLTEIMIKSASLVANISGTAIPMQKEIEQYLRGIKDDKAPLDKFISQNEDAIKNNKLSPAKNVEYEKLKREAIEAAKKKKN